MSLCQVHSVCLSVSIFCLTNLELVLAHKGDSPSVVTVNVKNVGTICDHLVSPVGGAGALGPGWLVVRDR